VVVAAGALIAAPALAQTPAGKPRVVIQTGMGPIVVELEAAKAPITVANFLHYVDTGRYDGGRFYRASRAPGAPTIGIIEGGTDNNPAKLYSPIAHESTTMTGLLHVDGTISMARDAPGTATADFFVCCGRLCRFWDGGRGHGHRPRHPRPADAGRGGQSSDAGPDPGPADRDRQHEAGGVRNTGNRGRSTLIVTLSRPNGPRRRAHDRRRVLRYAPWRARLRA